MEEKFRAAQHALDALEKAGADGASVEASIGSQQELTVNTGVISVMRTTFPATLKLKGLWGGRKGVVVSAADPAAIGQAALDCKAAAESAKPDEAESIAPLTENGAFSAGADSFDRDALYDRIQEFLDAAEKEFPNVGIEQLVASYLKNRVEFVNSNGVRHSYDQGYYDFSLMFSAHDETATSSFWGAYMTAESLEKPILDMYYLRRMLAECSQSITANPFPGKQVCPVILTPDCLDMFLSSIAVSFLSDQALISGSSPWKDKLGQAVAHSGITLSSRPFHPLVTCGERFTSDGYLSADLDIIKDGQLRQFLLTDYGARKTGLARAGNAGHNFCIEAGEKTLDELVGAIPLGLLVSRYSGGMPGPSGDFSGVAKNSFLIRDGKIEGAVSETMISGNLRRLLTDWIGFSSETCSNGRCCLPYAAFDGVTVSGS